MNSHDSIHSNLNYLKKIGETLNHQRFLYLAIFGLDFIHGNGWCLWWTPLKFPWNQLSPSSSKAPFAARGTRPHGPRGGCPTNRRHRRAGQAGAPGKSLVEWEISGKDVCFLTSFFIYSSFWCFFDVFFLIALMSFWIFFLVSFFTTLCWWVEVWDFFMKGLEVKHNEFSQRIRDWVVSPEVSENKIDETHGGTVSF